MLTRLAQDGGEVVGRAQGGGVVIAQCPAVAGQGVSSGARPARSFAVSLGGESGAAWQLSGLCAHNFSIMQESGLTTSARTRDTHLWLGTNRQSRYDDGCRFAGAEVVEDPSTAAMFVAMADLLWNEAIEFTSWWEAHPRYHRDVRVV